MPSDERTTQALEALAGPREAFRSALTAAIDQVAGIVAGSRLPEGERVERVAAELGAFARARIEIERFSSILEPENLLDPESEPAVERALAVLRELVQREDAPATVGEGEGLSDAVDRRMADAGRAFGASRVVELARAGSYRSTEHEGLLEAFPFSRWNRAERAMAPPLVVEVEGGQLRTGGLAEFLDGSAKIVLVVRGPSPPAPLARLVTPGVFVAQDTDSSIVERAVASDGPAIVALVSDSAARFVHDPAAGATLGQRLSVDTLPDEGPRNRLGAISAFQQAQDLDLLKILASAIVPAAPVAADSDGASAASEPAMPVEPADRLAAWLLKNTDLPPLEAEQGE